MKNTENRGSSRPLSAKEYYNFVDKKYIPSIYESNELRDGRFYPGTNYAHVCKTRCFMTYRAIVDLLPQGGRVLDLGAFPGTLVRQLKALLNEKVRCSIVGHKIDATFIKFISPYVENCVDAELDPFYLKDDRKIAIPVESDSFDAVVATEILEHLISPLEMIAEGARVLRPGGFFIITTPNVSHIGAVLKLLIGRSNYERLEESPMCMQNDPWRGHIRFYDKWELEKLFLKSGLEMISHKYYREQGWTHAKEKPIKKIIATLADKIAPIYREGHFAVFQKV